MEKKQSFLTTLANRAHLSMLGKGVIGLVGGTILIFVRMSRNREKKEPKLNNHRESWVENSIIDAATVPDSSARFEYFKVKGYKGRDVDTIISFINQRCKGGSLVKELIGRDRDSVSKLVNSEYNLTDNNAWIFYINSLDSVDFLLVLKDSSIVETISL